MKRTLLAAALLLSSTALFAADATSSYIVGTRHPAREAISRISRDDLSFQPRADRTMLPFDLIDAFEADLTPDEVSALSHSPEVRYVTLNVERHAFGIPTRSVGNELRLPNGQTTPYGVRLVRAPYVWPASRGQQINVVVVDTGIDLAHPDLQSAYAGGLNALKGEPAYPNETTSVQDDNGHGTHVSGTIAAADNSIGVVGVAPSVRLWMVRALANDPTTGSASGPSSAIIRGIQFATQKKLSTGGNWIISMSLGSCVPSPGEQEAINTALNAGLLVVVAAGNHDTTQPDTCTGSSKDNAYSVSYPAAYPGVLAVAAVDSSSTVADFSNFGPEVSIAGPGVDVLSTLRVGTGSIATASSASLTFPGSGLTGSPNGTASGKFVDCGLGNPQEFPASVSGNIAVIKRGDLTFAIKAKNAKAAGAAAVVIYNKDTSALNFTLQGDPLDASVVFPLTIAISLQDGQTLLTQAGSTGTVSLQPDDYGNESGTSMATPHVAGVAALIWSLVPSATASTVKQALLATAHDIGDPGVDIHTGHGLIDAYAAALSLAPSAFGFGAPPSAATGRTILRRGH